MAQVKYYDTGSSQWLAAVNGGPGLQGIRGTQGLSGLQGTQGLSGLQGTQGTQGLQGIQGTNAAATNTAVVGLLEAGNYVAAATSGTLAINITTSTVWYYTVASTSSFVLNFTSTASINSLLAIGQSVSVAVLNTTGAATTSYPTAFQVDSASVTPKWQNGSTPSAGSVSSIDAYTFTILKTANSTYTVLASQTKFA